MGMHCTDTPWLAGPAAAAAVNNCAPSLPPTHPRNSICCRLPVWQTPSWRGGAWCSCMSSTCRPGRPSTTATSAGGRQLLHWAAVVAATAFRRLPPAARGTAPCWLQSAPACAAPTAPDLLASPAPHISASPHLPFPPWPGFAGSWAPTSSAAAATGSSTPSACTTLRSAAPSCQAAPGPAPAAARSSRWGGQRATLGRPGGGSRHNGAAHTCSGRCSFLLARFCPQWHDWLLPPVCTRAPLAGGRGAGGG